MSAGTAESEHAATRESDLVRFRAKVDQVGPTAPILESPCWLWRGATDPRGYPKFWLRGNSVTAQRAALTLDGVHLGSDDQVVNLCGNRLCVRRDHLAVGTLRDAHALRYRGRHRLGPGELRLIQMAVGSGDSPAEHVAEALGVSRGLVEEIARAGSVFRTPHLSRCGASPGDA